MFVMTASGNDVGSLGFGFGLVSNRVQRKIDLKTARQIEKGKISLPDPVPIMGRPLLQPSVFTTSTLPDPVPIIGPGAGRADRRARKKQRKAKPPGPEPVPPLRAKKRRGKPAPTNCVQSANCPPGFCDNGSGCCDERMVLNNILPIRCTPYGGGGGGTIPPGPGGKPYPESAEGCIKETVGVGDCIHCCRANFQGKAKKQCVYGCNQWYSGGGGPGGAVPGPTPTPTQSCGYECVGPGDTGDMQCEYVCHDYGGGITPAAPSSDVYVPPSGGYAPGGGTPYVETEEPLEEEQTFIQKYGLYLAGAAALVIFLGTRSKSRR